MMTVGPGDDLSNTNDTNMADNGAENPWTFSGAQTSTRRSQPSSSATSSTDLISLLWIYSGPVIFVVGLCGNALILVVMTRRRMSGTSTSVHLSLMAIADMAVLCTGLVPEWIEAAFGIIPKEIHPVMCKFEKFMFYTR